MATLKQKQFSWLSLALLLICYTWFGWYLSGLKSAPWVGSICHQALKAPVSTHESKSELPASEPTPTKEESAPHAAAKPEQSVSNQSEPEASYIRSEVCRAVVKYNLMAGVFAIAWIVMSSMAFISPLTSFNAFISRWFKSDTVAFGTIFLIAGVASIILYWLHIFLQIITILAVDVLARIDIQYAGLTGAQAFWILTIVSFTGLVLGWTASVML
ncbi:MAG: hypothetical protein NW224_27025 [Leptolyngbyaceae cyanobacterium bins.302]|nr:hypothetical protein [Leptolyngbyaceae cyanobacterium bins.302]